MTLPVPHVNANSTGSSTTQNAMIDAINSLPRGYVDDARDGTGTVTLATVSTDYACTAAAAVTMSPTAQRRYHILVQARFVPGTTNNGRYSVQVGYNSGTSVALGSVTKAGLPVSVFNTPSPQTGNNGSTTEIAMADPLLAAGDWTIYMVVRRENGGDPTDTATDFHVIVHDVGAS